MLYERWRQIVQAHGNGFALRDGATGQEWTFGQLAEAARQWPGNEGAFCFPRGAGHEFVLGVLRAWECGQVVCPLELEQPAPALPAGLPGDIAHLKTTSATTREARLIAF